MSQPYSNPADVPSSIHACLCDVPTSTSITHLFGLARSKRIDNVAKLMQALVDGNTLLQQALCKQ